MKRNLRFLGTMLCAAFAAFAFTACSSDDDGDGDGNPPVNPIEKEYFTIENAEFVSGEMPESTTSDALQGVYCNDQALSNGGNFITISSPVEYERFYVAVEGVEGYYDFMAVNEATRADAGAQNFTYTIPVYYSVDLGDNFVLVISGVTVEGYITPKYTQEITHVESLAGDLLINLVFDQPKDVDLHLIMPSGREIYFSDKGDEAYNEETNSWEKLFGLDHDSNPGCRIDNLNNENISIPFEYVQKGKYTVIVNLYSNCDYSVPVNYSLQVRYKGELVENMLPEGVNPLRGYYEADASRGDHTVVMEFEINEGIEVDDNNDNYDEVEPMYQRRMIPQSPAAKAKLMMKND